MARLIIVITLIVFTRLNNLENQLFEVCNCALFFRRCRYHRVPCWIVICNFCSDANPIKWHSRDSRHTISVLFQQHIGE